MAEQQVAVLIDFENVGLGSIRWLFDEISELGRITIKRAYADWSVVRGERDPLLELGIEPVHLFRSTAGKNASDIRLTIDAVELLYLSEVDTFVIVSADSDFVPLVSKLRAAGKTVVGAGQKAKASRTLVISCDRYRYLDGDEATQPGKPSPKARQSDSLLVRATNAAMDDQGRATGSRLHQTLQRLDPSFDYKALGYSTLRRYLEAAPEVKVGRSQGQGDVSVELVEGEPSTTSADPDGWAAKIDAAWSQRAPQRGRPIYGSTAAGDAAKVLGFSKLSDSPHKTLQRLLDVTPELRLKWVQDGNKVTRR